MSQPCPVGICEHMERHQGERLMKVHREGMTGMMSWATASNPETWGLSLDNVSPLGFGHRDNGTLQQRSMSVTVWFVLQ